MLANYIVDKQKELHFNVPGVPIKRNDDNKTRDFILSMTPDQRKELSINKSTRGIFRRTCGRARRSSYIIRSRLRWDIIISLDFIT
jgi:CRISPR-associated protein Cas1